jgi:alkanesulfonate monooxygenase SsuD/methylene tetrahydromethanopterin reductase-like flavin-dependent oxidoreductase (luciferase family)
MDIAIMIEGQNGLNWPRWKRIVRAVEDLGFAGLYRSDHFTNSSPPDIDSLELWVSLAWLADNTRRIEFGPLVTPFSFRHPVHTARMASAVDDLSGGRLTLGLGAGWQAREHEKFGFQLLDIDSRFQRTQEGLEVVTRLLRRDSPSSFSGEFYTLQEALMLPRPVRPPSPRPAMVRGGRADALTGRTAGRPPILIGGNGEKRTLPLAAKYADEWNAVFTTADEVRRLNGILDGLLQEQGMNPADVRRSLMTGCVFGKSDAEVKEASNLYGDTTLEVLRQEGNIVGKGEQVSEQLAELAETGIDRVMLQWLDLDDLDGLEALAKAVL